MSETFDVSGGPQPEPLATAARALDAGGLAVLPTDTVYGVAARPDVIGATGRVFEAKRRPRDLILPVLASDAGQVAAVAVVDERADLLAERFWPGPLTLVLPRKEIAGGWDLGEARDSVGVRVPAHRVALALLHLTGPLAVTSANRSGEPTPPTCEAVRAALGDAVAVYLCAGTASSGTPSTVMDLTGPDARVLREGAIPSGDLFQALRWGSTGPAETRC